MQQSAGLLPDGRALPAAGFFLQGKFSDHFGDQSGPAALMASAHACAGVAMEVLVKRNIVAPVRIILEGFIAAENGSSSLRIAQEGGYQAAADLVGNFVQVHQPS